MNLISDRLCWRGLALIVAGCIFFDPATAKALTMAVVSSAESRITLSAPNGPFESQALAVMALDMWHSFEPQKRWPMLRALAAGGVILGSTAAFLMHRGSNLREAVTALALEAGFMIGMAATTKEPPAPVLRHWSDIEKYARRHGYQPPSFPNKRTLKLHMSKAIIIQIRFSENGGGYIEALSVIVGKKPRQQIEFAWSSDMARMAGGRAPFGIAFPEKNSLLILLPEGISAFYGKSILDPSSSFEIFHIAHMSQNEARLDTRLAFPHFSSRSEVLKGRGDIEDFFKKLGFKMEAEKGNRLVIHINVGFSKSLTFTFANSKTLPSRDLQVAAVSMQVEDRSSGQGLLRSRDIWPDLRPKKGSRALITGGIEYHPGIGNTSKLILYPPSGLASFAESREGIQSSRPQSRGLEWEIRPLPASKSEGAPSFDAAEQGSYERALKASVSRLLMLRDIPDEYWPPIESILGRQKNLAAMTDKTLETLLIDLLQLRWGSDKTGERVQKTILKILQEHPWKPKRLMAALLGDGVAIYREVQSDALIWAARVWPSRNFIAQQIIGIFSDKMFSGKSQVDKFVEILRNGIVQACDLLGLDNDPARLVAKINKMKPREPQDDPDKRRIDNEHLNALEQFEWPSRLLKKRVQAAVANLRKKPGWPPPASILDPLARRWWAPDSWKYRGYTLAVAPLWETAFAFLRTVFPEHLLALGIGFAFLHTIVVWSVRSKAEWEAQGVTAALAQDLLGVIFRTGWFWIFALPFRNGATMAAWAESAGLHAIWNATVMAVQQPPKFVHALSVAS